MINRPAESYLVRYLIGKVPDKRRSIYRGLFSGLLLFGIFEGISLVNSNIPQIPAVWLLSIVMPLGLIFTFIKISRVVRFPRTCNFFFVICLSSQQRKQIAARSIRAIYEAIMPFVISCAAVIAILEFSVMRDRSIMNLVIIPVVLILFIVLLFRVSEALLAGKLLRNSSKDMMLAQLHTGQFFVSVLFAKVILTLSRTAGRLTPEAIRPLVIRNFLYLFRSDPLIFPFFICAAPVLLSVLLILINNPLSPFLDFFTLLAIFSLCYYNANQLRESRLRLKECPWYEYGSKQFLLSFAALSVLLAVPFTAIFLIRTRSTLFSAAGLVRAGTLFLALIPILLTAARPALRTEKKDSDIATDAVLFLAATLGCFIPLFGWIFTVLTLAAVLLLQWETLHETGKIPVDCSDGLTCED
ncbi:MAG: hypothetical protein GX556_01865 [Fibrobacter sp.]|nr:hypothetical protein [Fibrobacter sp.]